MSVSTAAILGRIVRDYVLPTAGMVTIVAGCLALGKWQWDAAFAHQSRQIAGSSADVRDLSQVTKPLQWLPRTAIGARVKVTGHLQSAYSFTTKPRPTSEGDLPWVVTPLKTADGSVVAVVQGSGVRRQRASQVSFIGRLQPSEDSPAIGAWQPTERELSTGTLVDRWPFPVVLDGYVIAESPVGLGNAATATPRFTAAPSGQVAWRNLAYAVQWLLFAVFAAFVWWRHLATVRQGE